MKPRFNQKYKGIMCRVYLVRENPDSEIISISDSSAAYELVKEELVNSDRERFLSIMLTIKNHLIGVETVAVGSNHACVIRPVDVLRGPMLANAFGCILAHNHPSGVLTPSDNDIELTKHLIEAGELLGIKVLDHLIISDQGYRSLRGYCNFPL